MKPLQECIIWTFSLLILMAQGGLCEDSSGGLENWLVGTIAVCVFLVLAFVFMLVNHYVCANLFIEPEDDDLDEEAGYENHVAEIEDDMPTEKVEGTPLAAKDQHEYSEVHKSEGAHQYEDFLPAGTTESKEMTTALTPLATTETHEYAEVHKPGRAHPYEDILPAATMDSKEMTTAL